MEIIIGSALQFAPHETHPVIRCERRDDFGVFLESFFMIGRPLKHGPVSGFNTLPIVVEGSFYLCCRSAGSKDKSIWKC